MPFPWDALFSLVGAIGSAWAVWHYIGKFNTLCDDVAVIRRMVEKNRV